jgi:hypothetical protein
MGVRLKGLLALLTLGGAIIALTQTAIAQDAGAEPDNVVTLREAFTRAYYSHDGNYYQNRSLGRQLDWILGAGINFENSFTDNEISSDGEAVDRLYRDAFRQQIGSDPVIRTPDLPNPYDTSYLLSPQIAPTPPPPATPSSAFDAPPAPAPAPAPAPVQAAPARPIPALW